MGKVLPVDRGGPVGKPCAAISWSGPTATVTLAVDGLFAEQSSLNCSLDRDLRSFEMLAN